MSGTFSAFSALVTVGPDTTSLTALATTMSGATASHTVPIAVTSPAQITLDLLANPQGGAAPLRVAFSLMPTPVSATIELDFDGDGAVDFTGSSLEGQAFTYTQPGVYYPTVRVTDAGGTAVATTMVQAFDRSILDAQLQAKWDSLRESLRQGDVDNAVDLFAQGSKEAYRAQLTALAGVGALSQIAADLGAINPIRLRDGAAEYDLRALRNGREYSFHVLFIIDIDGLWRLRGF